MTSPTGKWSEVEFTPHGYPYNIAVRMHPVTSGGGACQ